MPIGWLGYSMQQGRSPVGKYQYDELHIVGEIASDNNQTIRSFKNGVVATYGPERLTADAVEVHLAPEEQFAIATGHVRLVDPDGTVTGDSLKFSWKADDRWARGENVEIHVVGSTVRAKSIDLTPGKWVLNSFYFTSDRASHPLYAVRGRTITIYPGKSAKVVRPGIDLFGHKIATWPSQSFNLDPRSTGLRLPRLKYSFSGGIGYSWQAGSLLNQRTDLEWHTDASNDSRPGFGAQLIRSFVPPGASQTPLPPKGEFSQRFSYGYFESLLVASPEREEQYLSSPRSSVDLETNFNAGVSGRGSVDETFSTPLAASYEISGKHGLFGYLGDARLETIRRIDDSALARGVLSGSLEIPKVSLSPSLFVTSRADFGAYYSGKSFGWGRLTEGLVYRPSHWMTLSAAAVGAVQGGTPDYDIDPLFSTNGLAFRADFNFGSRTISLMNRYDVRRAWFDQELSLVQAVGPFNAYVTYRRYPGETRFGLELRLDQFEDLLNRRKFRRPSQTKSGSGP